MKFIAPTTVALSLAALTLATPTPVADWTYANGVAYPIGSVVPFPPPPRVRFSSPHLSSQNAY